MHGTIADVRPGERFNHTVEFISKRQHGCDGKTVPQLLVTNQAGDQFNILATPDVDSISHLESGETYEITGLIGAGPVDTSSSVPHDCPDCGSPLREGQAIDAVSSTVVEVAETAGVDERFGVLDQISSITRVDAESTIVDDWLPMTDGQPDETPDYVCTSCGHHIDNRELQHDDQGPADERRSDVGVSCVTTNGAETVGLAAGGAKDVTNFRENIANGYTPEPEAISDEGLFYDYYFETGEQTATDSLFAPRYATAVSKHPLTGETEQYLSVGLDSTLSTEAFERPRLDLVAVLDVSGSMSSAFDEYYYDQQGNKQKAETKSEAKIEAATQSLCALTEQLHAEDRLGVVLYNHRAHVAKPLREVGATDMPAIRQHIRNITASGSTNMEDGFEAAVDMLADRTGSSDVERRVIFMTDMMPNTGETDAGGLSSLFADAAIDGIHTTFIGMGLDTNTELADTLSEIRGANHYFIHSADKFEQRLSDEFDYMVTPLVYDLDLELDADGYEIKAVHGSPSADAGSEQLMHVGTLFPSTKQDGEARGGIVLVRLSNTGSGGSLELRASWTERDGSDQTERLSVSLADETESFAHDGIRKAVALARYARELRTWTQDIHNRTDTGAVVDDWLLTDQHKEHERESVPLVVPDEYAGRFDDLHSYLSAEMDVVGDDSLEQELSLLNTLSDSNAANEADPQEEG